MSPSLYAVAFSGGLVKVGRSKKPLLRVASHEGAAASFGVQLLDRYIVECVGNARIAEKALIVRCSAASTSRRANEWFGGLLFTDVCAWVDETAAMTDGQGPTSPNASAIEKTLTLVGGQQQLAKLLEVSKQAVSFWAIGARVPSPELCVEIERVTGGRVTRVELRPEVFGPIKPYKLVLEDNPEPRRRCRKVGAA